VSPPERQKVCDLAGPNNILQLVLDAASWTTLAKVTVGAFAAAFIAQTGKNAADALWNNPKKLTNWLQSAPGKSFGRLLNAIRSAIGKECTVSLAVDANVSNATDARLPAVTIWEGSESEVLRTIAVLGNVGTDLIHVLEFLARDKQLISFETTHTRTTWFQYPDLQVTPSGGISFKFSGRLTPSGPAFGPITVVIEPRETERKSPVAV
jgi:hypothetical protein